MLESRSRPVQNGKAGVAVSPESDFELGDGNYFASENVASTSRGGKNQGKTRGRPRGGTSSPARGGGTPSATKGRGSRGRGSKGAAGTKVSQ